MQLINATRMTAGYNMGVEVSGRELLVVVIKGTFVLPKPGEPVRLADEQLPLIMADTFTGEPGFSSPLYEIDFAPRKQACDVLLVGSAHAPEGKAVTRMRVRLQVGTMVKEAEVVGPRVWNANIASIGASDPEHFTCLPLSYDVAFGGADRHHEDESEHDAYLPNPAGRGWHKHLKSQWVDGSPLPNLEVPGQPVTDPGGKYTPISFGPLARGWPARARFAGTYDQQWLDDVFPFLPKDFDERYFQAAPEDQQLPLPTAPLEVVLSGFTPDGERRFMLPHFEAPVTVIPRQGKREEHIGQLDTIVFEPDSERFTMTWRLTRPLRSGIFELFQILVGRKGREWWQQRDRTVFPLPVVMIAAGEAEAQEADDDDLDDEDVEEEELDEETDDEPRKAAGDPGKA